MSNSSRSFQGDCEGSFGQRRQYFLLQEFGGGILSTNLFPLSMGSMNEGVICCLCVVMRPTLKAELKNQIVAKVEAGPCFT